MRPSLMARQTRRGPGASLRVLGLVVLLVAACSDSEPPCSDGSDGLLLFSDADGDLFGAPGTEHWGCSEQPGQVSDDTDCDDSQSATNPDAVELCDGADNDCDGFIGVEEEDSDQDGFRVCDGDCDDADPERSPDAEEACDGIDNDCTSSTQPPGGDTDDDGDGWLGCADCDDHDATTAPDLPELCDGLDNNCDGTIDEGLQPQLPFGPDDDGDGHGSIQGAIMACAAPPGLSPATDCDDQSASVRPGAPEYCDGKDTDCDGQTGPTDVDSDNDGVPLCAGDCDDTDPVDLLAWCHISEVLPSGTADFCDGIDQGGDGVIDPCCGGPAAPTGALPSSSMEALAWGIEVATEPWVPALRQDLRSAALGACPFSLSGTTVYPLLAPIAPHPEQDLPNTFLGSGTVDCNGSEPQGGFSVGLTQVNGPIGLGEYMWWVRWVLGGFEDPTSQLWFQGIIGHRGYDEYEYQEYGGDGYTLELGEESIACVQRQDGIGLTSFAVPSRYALWANHSVEAGTRVGTVVRDPSTIPWTVNYSLTDTGCSNEFAGTISVEVHGSTIGSVVNQASISFDGNCDGCGAIELDGVAGGSLCL